MIVVSVKFKGRGKAYYFDPNGLDVPEGVPVVVETSKGMELADCVQGNHEVTDERIVPPLRPVLRLATADDLRVAEICKAREKDAFKIAEQKIADHGLDMKLVDVECNFEGNKILFFFTSDGRVDFRELVKDLAGVFRTRIELRQIGVRDEAKMLGGIGICGRPFCCHQFLDDFEPVSTKMAKTQSLSLNPTKISGSCGRLMCCLRYEQEAYEELVKSVPKNGAFVETTAGYGNVTQVNLLRQQVKVKLDGDDNSFRSFDADEVAVVPGGRPKPGEPLPHVLTAQPKKKEPEEPEERWVMPPIFAEDTADETPEKREKPGKPDFDEKRSGDRNHRSRHRGGKKPAAPGGEKKPEAPAPKPEQPAAPPAGEKSADGEKKSGDRNHRNHRRGGKKPAAPGTQPKEEAGSKAPAQQKPQPKPQQKPQPKAPSGEGKPAPAGEGGQKKSGNPRYRNYHRKPKPRPNGGGEGGAN